ncbi:hypothetical protein C8Q79DRAFT_203933 [Trametes meyenii]|nr:hypothetical protein C8Q79DRAFT_203933 [Trametes meyenii]
MRRRLWRRRELGLWHACWIVTHVEGLSHAGRTARAGAFRRAGVIENWTRMQSVLVCTLNACRCGGHLRHRVELERRAEWPAWMAESPFADEDSLQEDLPRRRGLVLCFGAPQAISPTTWTAGFCNKLSMLGASVSDCLPRSGEGGSLGRARHAGSQGFFLLSSLARREREIDRKLMDSGASVYATRAFSHWEWARPHSGRTLLLHHDGAPPARSFIAFIPCVRSRPIVH